MFRAAASWRVFRRLDKNPFAIFSGSAGHRTLSMNVKSTGARENSDGSVGRESEAPPADPFHGATRRTIQGPSNTISGGDAAGENDRREALRFPALQFCDDFAPTPKWARDRRSGNLSPPVRQPGA
jgi:hypothetical protein